MTLILVSSYDTSSTHDFSVWDAVYFRRISERGYAYEQETAFFPGLPGLLAILWPLPGEIISVAAHVGATAALHRLTTNLAPRLADMTAQVHSYNSSLQVSNHSNSGIFC